MDTERMAIVRIKRRLAVIDLHIHLLPGVDDGASDMEDALEMAWQASESGVTAVAATSHATLKEAMDGEWIERYKENLEEFRRRVKEQKINLEIYEGAEILVNERVDDILKEKRVHTINGSRYPLVEFPFQLSSQEMENALRGFLAADYTPILAHPERYRCVQRQLAVLYQWQDLGVLFQVNKGSFSGEFGRRARYSAEWILKQQLAGIVASDAHDPCIRTPYLEDVADYLRWNVGNSGVQFLLEENPRRILKNRTAL